MAAGIGIGVAVVLLAASVPTARHHRDARIHGRIDVNLDDRVVAASQRTVLVSDIDTVFRGVVIRGRLVEPEGPDAPLPPGLDRYPQPGEMVVSPALGRLLAQPANGLLRARLDHPVAGEVNDSGLLGPGEYVFFLGGEHMESGVAGARRLDHFGKVYADKPLAPDLVLLTVVGIVVLLTPVAVFIAAAMRFGGEHRDRRLAALRLIGADRGMTARIAAGEALVSSLIGIVVGAALFAVGRRFVELVDVQGLSVFPRDLTPEPSLAAVVVVAVPCLSLISAHLAMNKVVAEPLGVVRRSVTAKRRLWWRVALPLFGLLLLRTSVRDATQVRSTAGVVTVVAGMLALLVGVTAVIPWLLERFTERVGGSGPLSWQLAMRRLRSHGEASTRSVNGIVVAVAGAIALQTLFTGIAHSPTGNHPSTPQARSAPDTRVSVVRLVGAQGEKPYAPLLARTPGVTRAVAFSEMQVSERPQGIPQTVRIAGCAELRLLASVSTCSGGDAFLVTPRNGGTHDMTEWETGTRMRMGESGPVWRVPRITATVRARPGNPQGAFPETMLLATPGAAGTTATAHATPAVSVAYRTSREDVQDRIRTAAVRLNPRFQVDFPDDHKEDTALSSIRRALLAGVAVVLLLIATSMLIGAVEQLRDQKRVMAMLVAVGARRRTLSGSVLWQTALPVAIGMLVASVVGTALGGTLLHLVGRTVVFDWGSMLAMTGIGAGSVLLVTLSTLPTLRQVTRVEAIRHE
ncbi:ABC transporter permease [Streptomyces spinosus]|uniref:ABC transporter permease n=1 Tax=Streptomyces spinosus TaxID=2872623 RepID=UPI001CEC315A|nr:ABC transporter permease [Streptomyces spinosus]